MRKIVRNTGLTPSEKRMAQLADHTFLDLWSYPNPFADRRSGSKGDGKEICDLLVVCGDDVIIFSDKEIAWPSGSLELSWSRWFKRAVTKSIDQLRGAERWLRLYPDRIFLDAACTQKLPFDLPPPGRIRVHCVAVAIGAFDACSKHYRDRDGSLLINGRLSGAKHTETSEPAWMPFAIGDVAPDGSFVHVFDRAGFNLVMREMDTILDFIRYLTARAGGIRWGPIGLAGREADLVAVYAQSDIGDGEHGFPLPADASALTIPRFDMLPGLYSEYTARPEYAARRAANAISYRWDDLIRLFTQNVLGGTSVAIADVEPDAALAEMALRAMALEDRTGRRILGEAFVGALTQSVKEGKDRFARVVVSRKGTHDPKMGYVFLIMAFREKWLVAKGYDFYRAGRVSTLRAYCEVALLQNPGLTQMLGIAIDAAQEPSDQSGGSEDLMLVRVDAWTDDYRNEVQRLAAEHEILIPGRLRKAELRTTEYPALSDVSDQAPLNRQQRRAAERAKRKGSATRH